MGLPYLSENRVHKAIAKWKNQTLDPEPILIDARLVTPIGKAETVLALCVSDENKDLAGIGIRESSPSVAKERWLNEEIYPIYHHFSPAVVSNQMIPVLIRKNGERKDQQRWREYMTHGCASDNIPPILVSFPEPNEIEVWIWLYDKAGNKSEPIKLIYFTGK